MVKRGGSRAVVKWAALRVPGSGRNAIRIDALHRAWWIAVELSANVILDAIVAGDRRTAAVLVSPARARGQSLNRERQAVDGEGPARVGDAIHERTERR